MKIIFKSEDRGYANHGWLEARHTFSFANWYNPDRVHFGAMRVFNDDRVAPKMGFGTHPHDNMEIITIPLAGTVRHRDNMGNEGEIHPGEIQIMSAGSGVTHSEFNPSLDEELRLFQIWIFPEKRNVEPRYQQLRINEFGRKNSLVQLVSPDPEDDGGWIHQQAWIHYLDAEQGHTIDYQSKKKGNGVFIMNIEGQFTTVNAVINHRDAIGITDIDSIPIQVDQDSKILIIEVPLTF